MQRATSALNCLSAIATAVLVVSAFPAAAEPDAITTGAIETRATETRTIESNEHPIEAPALGMTLAAIDPFSLGTKDTEGESAIGQYVSYPNGRIYLSAEDAIVGIASFYDDPQQTASGEQYDPNAYTAAAQLEIRHRFGGVRYGRLYQAAYGLGEYRGKKIIVRFNDVGPLRPGRKFDLSRAAMAYFDSTLEVGLLPDFKMTPLPLGRSYPKGPITDEQLAALGIDDDAAVNVCEVVLNEEQPIYASKAQPNPSTVEVARVERPKTQATPPAVAKRSASAKLSKAAKAKMAKAAKLATKRAAAKAKLPRRAVKTAPTRATAKVAAAAPKASEQTATVTPWVKRVWKLVSASASDNQPAPHTGSPASEKRRVVAQAR
jgi:rare lipoprotein A